MSIRILPENEIKQAAASYTAPPLLFSNPKNLYQRRAARLRELAQDHPLADYLLFAAAIADAQLALLQSMPIPQDPRLQALSGEQLANKPLDVKNWQRDPIWRKLLTALLEKLKPSANDQILTTIEWLEKAADSELEDLADKVLAQEFATISSDKAVFVWAALVPISATNSAQRQTRKYRRFTSLPSLQCLSNGQHDSFRYKSRLTLHALFFM